MCGFVTLEEYSGYVTPEKYSGYNQYIIHCHICLINSI